MARLTEELETTTTTLKRVRRHVIFGPRTEITDTVLGKDKQALTDTPALPVDADPAAPGATDGETTLPSHKKTHTGHGRNGADQSPRAPHIALTPSVTPP